LYWTFGDEIIYDLKIDFATKSEGADKQVLAHQKRIGKDYIVS
jgi:hypothetical protein